MEHDESNASAELMRAELLHNLGEDIPITRDFLANVPFGGELEQMYGLLVGELVRALSAIERRANGGGND